jgi:hypothetical protein
MLKKILELLALQWLWTGEKTPLSFASRVLSPVGPDGRRSGWQCCVTVSVCVQVQPG